MSKSIQSAFNDLGKTGDELYAKVCTVVSVDTNKKTCELKPVDDSAKLFDVPFSADVAGDGLVNYPKVGSNVLVVFLDKHNAQICNVSELEKSYLKIGGVEFKVSAEGFLLKKENENLKILMADFLTAIKNMSFTTNYGPTINLINIAEFEALEPRFNDLLKDS